MKILVNIARVLVGFLFIFSGLVKANDPLGLTYKMQEFFDVWAQNASLAHLMHWLDNYALPFSIIIITLEIILGVGILIGVWRRFFSYFLLLLIIFFSFLTGYAVLSGKIATCGCLGDCLPLTAMQSFIKDLVLLALIIFICFGIKYIQPIMSRIESVIILLICTFLVLWLQWFVLRHNPFVDCLPFKKGNNIIELRKIPADAVQEKKTYKFFYQKNGEEKEFSQTPDSTWKFSRREDIIIQEAKNNIPLILDFDLKTLSGNDSTEAILNTPGPYCLFFVKDISGGTDYWINNFVSIYNVTKSKNITLFIVTSQPAESH